MKSTLIIKKNSIFRYILRNGKFYKGNCIVVHISDKKVLKNQKTDTNYLGICVSKKNGNSVCRNKLKRWVREIYKNEESKLKKNYSIVVLFKKNYLFENINYSQVLTDIKNCFKELDLYE